MYYYNQYKKTVLVLSKVFGYIRAKFIFLGNPAEHTTLHKSLSLSKPQFL